MSQMSCETIDNVYNPSDLQFLYLINTLHTLGIFTRTARIDNIPSNEVFSWHIREGAFERLNPPWQQFTVIERKGSIQSNEIVKIKINAGPFHMKWLVKHSDYIEGFIYL
jgi:ligand-binding SRPBCC domain-containing protein